MDSKIDLVILSIIKNIQILKIVSKVIGRCQNKFCQPQMVDNTNILSLGDKTDVPYRGDQ